MEQALQAFAALDFGLRVLYCQPNDIMGWIGMPLAQSIDDVPEFVLLPAGDFDSASFGFVADY